MKREASVLAALYLLTAIVTVVAVWIEVLNARAGGVLPRNERRADGTMMKWRERLATEERWRQTLGPRDESRAPIDRPLTTDESCAMQSDLARNRADNALHDVLSSAGLLQCFLLLPAMAIFGCLALVDRGFQWRLVWPTLVLILATVLAVERSYFGSLGG